MDERIGCLTTHVYLVHSKQLCSHLPRCGILFFREVDEHMAVRIEYL